MPESQEGLKHANYELEHRHHLDFARISRRVETILRGKNVECFAAGEPESQEGLKLDVRGLESVVAALNVLPESQEGLKHLLYLAYQRRDFPGVQNLKKG